MITPLYKKMLGRDFGQMPEQLQALHDLSTQQVWRGRAQVRRGTGWLAWLAATIIGLPGQGDETPVRVTLTPGDGGEHWLRNFDGKEFASFQSAGKGRYDGLLLERFGLLTIALELDFTDDRLYLIPRYWNLLGISLPGFLLPGGNNFEEESNGVFRFNVEMKAPVIGLIVSYKGWLTP